MQHYLTSLKILCLLLCLQQVGLAQGMLDKLKDKAKDASKQKTEKVKTNTKNSGNRILNDRFEDMRNSYDSTNFSFAIALSDNSGLYEYEERAEKYKKNLVRVTDAVGITEDLSQDPLKVAKDFNDLGQFSYANNRFKRAEGLFKLAKAEFENKQAQNTLYYPKVIANQGLLYLTTGRYQEALEANLAALEMRKQLDANSTAYATSLNNLAMTYKSIGQYNEAEQHFDQALEVIKKNEGKESISYAIVLNNKGMLFQTIGRYAEAETLLKEALTTAKNTLREKSNNYQRMLVNLALLYQDQKKYEEADKILQDAVKLKEKRLGNRNHPDLAHMLNLQASLYVEMGKDTQVEALLQEALRIYEKNFGKEHPAYANTASNLGNFYRIKDRLAEAEELLTQVLAVRKNTLGEKHPDYNKAQEDLALLYWQMKNISAAANLYRQVLAQNQAFIKTYFPPMSEVEKERYWDKLRPTYLRFYSFATDNETQDPELLRDMYEAHLATKAILLSTTNKIKNEILNSNDAQLIKEYQQWVTQKELLVRYYSYSKEELASDNINLDSLERAANTSEKSISTRIPELFESPKTYKELISKLQPTEAAIDIISFQHFDKQFTDQTHYAFLIADKNAANAPQLVLLKEGNDLDQKYYKYYRNAIQNQKEDKYSYEKFWAPIDAKVSSKTKLYISLDGVYNQISLNTLLKPNGKYLLEEKTLVFLTNNKDLIQNKTAAVNTSKEAFLIGFPEYGSTGTITPLPGTKVEVQNIDRLLKQSGYKATTLTALQATETAIKAVRNPSILHIATHGYFLNDPLNTGNNKVFGIEIEKARENPLLRSGIFLANAESGLKGQSSKQVKLDDNGVLTAFEAANLSLQNTTVVLSACETGLGDVKVGEGVYGLQRALQIAGADIIIMSLWTVSDEATQEFMTLFYKNYLATKDKTKSFRLAQTQLKAKLKAPYYWGAFVMIGK